MISISRATPHLLSPQIFIAPLLLALVAPGCARTSPPAASDEVVASTARAAIAPFKGALKEALTSALATSPESAIEVCAEKAPELARAASKGGIVVGRSAIRLRNPDNAPRPWLAPVMAELAAAPSGNEAHRVVALDGGRRGYAEAIWTAPPCLGCHGESLAPSIDQKIRARYPDDKARGFKAGELRGVFWAELEPSALAPPAK